MAGDGKARAPQILGYGIAATQEQDSPAARQLLGQRETWNGQTMRHAGYDSDQESQEPT
jgi:hypothetical protein